MIVITARSFAEILHEPMIKQIGILAAQKYPKQVPYLFRIPYYKPALDAIRKYYRNNNSRSIITQSIAVMRRRIKNQVKLRHNIRILRAFSASKHSKRNFIIQRQLRLIANPHPNLSLKLFYDIEAVEKSNEVKIFFNFHSAPIEEQVAKDTIRIAQWIQIRNSVSCTIRQLEYVDFMNNKVYRVRQQSTRLNRQIPRYAQIVSSIWQTI